MKKGYKEKKLIGYAEVGSHNKIFEFVPVGGNTVGDNYPHLLHIYSKKLLSDLVRVKIIYEVKVKCKKEV